MLSLGFYFSIIAEPWTLACLVHPKDFGLSMKGKFHAYLLLVKRWFLQYIYCPLVKKNWFGKVGKNLKGSLDSFPWVKIQITGRKVCLRCKGITLLGICQQTFENQTKRWHQPAMFCLITSSKFYRQYFEVSLKVKVMGSNPGYI